MVDNDSFIFFKILFYRNFVAVNVALLRCGFESHDAKQVWSDINAVCTSFGIETSLLKTLSGVSDEGGNVRKAIEDNMSQGILVINDFF